MRFTSLRRSGLSTRPRDLRAQRFARDDATVGADPRRPDPAGRGRSCSRSSWSPAPGGSPCPTHSRERHSATTVPPPSRRDLAIDGSSSMAGQASSSKEMSRCGLPRRRRRLSESFCPRPARTDSRCVRIRSILPRRRDRSCIVSLNGTHLDDLLLEWNPERIGQYQVTVPAGIVHAWRSAPGAALGRRVQIMVRAHRRPMSERIVMVASSYPRFAGDSVGSFMEPIAQGIAARGHEVHLVAPWHPKWNRPKIDRGVHFHLFHYAPVAGAEHVRLCRRDARRRPAARIGRCRRAAGDACRMVQGASRRAEETRDDHARALGDSGRRHRRGRGRVRSAGHQPSRLRRVRRRAASGGATRRAHGIQSRALGHGLQRGSPLARVGHRRRRATIERHPLRRRQRAFQARCRRARARAGNARHRG